MFMPLFLKLYFYPQNPGHYTVKWVILMHTVVPFALSRYFHLLIGCQSKIKKTVSALDFGIILYFDMSICLSNLC